MHLKHAQKSSLILSGGGARGAYQVGVLKGLCEILKSQGIPVPFRILSGTSAGAINTAFLACQEASFEVAVEKLVYLWSNIHTDQVFKSDLLSLNKFSFKNILSSAAKDSSHIFSFNAILDTSPLKKLIEENCDFSKIQKNLDSHKMESVVITANNYIQGSAVSFIQTPDVFDLSKLDWQDSRRVSHKTEINAQHILASSAIPMLFPPVKIESDFYGDGCVRNHTPCSPCIRLGSNHLFVVGVRSQRKNEPLVNNKYEQVSMIRILNTLLNAVLLDSVEQDVHRIERINHLIDQAQSKTNSLKKIPALCISPSVNLSELAREKSHKLPRLLRLTISAFGHLDEASEILSYLMFDAEYCKRLIDIGYHDALSEKKTIIEFFSSTTQQKDYIP